MNAPELTAFAHMLEERLNNAIDGLKKAVADHGELKEQVDRALPVLDDSVKMLKAWKETYDQEQQAYINLKRDVDELKQWRSDLKDEQKERTKWHRTFGPTIVGALISAIVAFLVVWIKK